MKDIQLCAQPCGPLPPAINGTFTTSIAASHQVPSDNRVTCSQTPGLFVEVFDGQYLPVPDTGVAPVKRALSAGLDYAPEPGSGDFSGALFRLAGELTDFSMRFTGVVLCPATSAGRRDTAYVG